ncbi:hypothetical protein OUZ56_012762 [Daphnia magna]|uniref:Retrotransposon gag domain-containing protein n=1 Tax=Daphnia magna TaxID=35525 RepID=A0ABQ9Z403_9CRUS|nr:hypothetical protein OUZ56_012762 [Daphnia magna]
MDPLLAAALTGIANAQLGLQQALVGLGAGKQINPLPAALGRDFFFDGATEEKFFEWQAAVQRVSVTEGWNPEQTRQVALRNLRGDAASWHDQVGVNIPDFDDWMNSLKRTFVRALIESSW